MSSPSSSSSPNVTCLPFASSVRLPTPGSSCPGFSQTPSKSCFSSHSDLRGFACLQCWGLELGPCLGKCSVPQSESLSSAFTINATPGIPHCTHRLPWSFLPRTCWALKRHRCNLFRMSWIWSTWQKAGIHQELG